MAKLAAHGRTELARLEKSLTSAESLDQGALETFTIALMSDGSVLQKWKLSGGRWKNHPLTKNWRLLASKWTRDNKTLEACIANFEKKGWKKV